MLTQTAGVLLTNSGTNGSASLLSMLLPFVILIAVFYFLLIRPENKKKKAAAKMRSELAVGDEITTIGGVVGTICQVKEDTIIIETSADRVRMEFTKWGHLHQGHPVHGERSCGHQGFQGQEVIVNALPA